MSSVIEARVSHEGPFEITKELNLPTQGEMAVTVTRVINGTKKMWTDRIPSELVSEAADPWGLGDNIAQLLMAKLNHTESIL
jgi:cobalamin biosynthesis protein CbiG